MTLSSIGKITKALDQAKDRYAGCILTYLDVLELRGYIKVLEETIALADAERDEAKRQAADKQAIIEEQEREIFAVHDEIQHHKGGAERYAKYIERLAWERNEARAEVAKLREWGKKDKAIIDELDRELATAKRTNTYTYILPAEARRLARYWYAKALEARAECTELAKSSTVWNGNGWVVEE